MMKKNLLLGFGLLLLLASAPILALAQDPAPSADPAFDYLQNGQTLFPFPEWTLGLDASAEDGLSVVWDRSVPFALSRYELQFIDFTGDFDTLIDADWMAGILSNYAQNRIFAQCQLGDYYLVEFSAEDEGIKYVGRYWAWQDNAGFNSFFSVYSESDNPELQTLSDALFPTAITCARG